MKKYNSGFSIAETLITLGIVGVIATLTLPILATNIQQKILISKWRKIYSDINQAFELVKLQDDFEKYYKCSEYYCFQDIPNLIVQKYIIKSAPKSGYPMQQNLKIATYKTILGDNFIYTPTIHYSWDSKDMSIYAWSYDPARCIIFVDVNGEFNPPNMLGKDFFALEIINDKMSPIGQYATGDFCKGTGTNLNAKVQANYKDNNNNLHPVPLSNYAGLGCSYVYLFNNKEKTSNKE